jgi:hypothetical protein
MSTPFREFLKEKATAYAVQAKETEQVIVEWRAAVDRLFEQLRGWLRTSDPDEIINYDITQADVAEPGLGRYQVSRLNLRAFGKWVSLIPKARKTVKRAHPQQPGAPEQATGRVDITDEIRRYVLYRFSRDGRDEWHIHDTAKNNDLQLLTPERFESALMSYFK